MGKHTKGPWEVATYAGQLGSVESADGTIVAQAQEVSVKDRTTGHHTRKANARLIAAAPDLLDALIKCRAEMAGLPRSLGYDFTHLPQLDALIARATGEQP